MNKPENNFNSPEEAKAFLEGYLLALKIAMSINSDQVELLSDEKLGDLDLSITARMEENLEFVTPIPYGEGTLIPFFSHTQYEMHSRNLQQKAFLLLHDYYERLEHGFKPEEVFANVVFAQDLLSTADHIFRTERAWQLTLKKRRSE